MSVFTGSVQYVSRGQIISDNADTLRFYPIYTVVFYFFDFGIVITIESGLAEKRPCPMASLR